MKAIGHDDQGEPIWMLNDEEYQRWKRESASARAKAKAGMQQQDQSIPQESMKEPESTKGESSHQNEAVVPSPHAMELGSRIWEMRKRGLSVYEISRKEGLPMDAVKTCLEQFERCFYPDVGTAMSQRLALDDARLDNLFQVWMPLATGGPVAVRKVDKKGREYTEFDSETPVKAAGIVLTAIQRRIQLAMACRTDGSGAGKDGGSTNVLVWLSQVMPGIQKVVNQVEAAPVSRARQTLVLECQAEAEADINSNGSKR